MLGNIKEFISTVQDGLTSNDKLLQRLHEVQKVKNIFKDRQKVHTESKVNFGAGAELLEKYQNEWADLHENADRTAKAADEVDKLILELHEDTRKKLESASELAHGLSHLPNLTAAVAQCMDSVRNVQSLLKTVEEELVDLEDIVEKSIMEKRKLDHHFHLSLYKDKKMAALEEIRSTLVKKNVDQAVEHERRQLEELQTRRETSAVAFQSDVAKYITSGTLPAGPAKSPTVTLEQIELDSDQTDLEKFLDS